MAQENELKLEDDGIEHGKNSSSANQ